MEPCNVFMGGETITILKSDYDTLKALVVQLSRRVAEIDNQIRLLKNKRNNGRLPPAKHAGIIFRSKAL